MKAIRRMLTLMAAVTLTGCAGGAGPSEPEESVTTGTTQESLTVADCQRQVASCTRAAHSLTDLAGCTTAFQACTTQAAADLVGHGNLLSTCRSKANTCLTAAATLADVSACRNVFDACLGDVQSTAGDAVQMASDAARDAINKAATIAVDVIQSATDAPSDALDALAVCEQQANTCLSAALSTGAIQPCRDAFDRCTRRAVAIVDNAVDPLPLPTPTQLANGFSQCQTKARTCLSRAVTSADVSACQGTLSQCVRDAAGIVDQTVNGVGGLLPPLPLPLPPLTQPVDCAAQATQCLLTPSNPIDCAAQAEQCLTH